MTSGEIKMVIVILEMIKESMHEESKYNRCQYSLESLISFFEDKLKESKDESMDNKG